MSHPSLPGRAASLHAHLHWGGNCGFLRGQGSPSQLRSARRAVQQKRQLGTRPCSGTCARQRQASGQSGAGCLQAVPLQMHTAEQHNMDKPLTASRTASSLCLARVKEGAKACSMLLAAPLRLQNERHKRYSLAISGTTDACISQGEGRKEVVQNRVCLLLPCIVVGEEAAGPSHGCLAQAYGYCEQQGAAQHLGVGPVRLSLLPPAGTIIG